MERTTTIIIVGIGALGSHLALLLRNEGDLVLVDHDKIESKNVLAQMHTRMAMGKNKTQAMQQLLQGFFGVKSQAIPHKLTKDNTDQLLGKAGLLVDCLDNKEARALVQTFAKDRGIPCVHGALAADGSFARVAWSPNFVIDPEGVVGQPTCEDGEFLPFIAIAASYLALAIQEYLRRGRKIGYQISPGATFRV